MRLFRLRSRTGQRSFDDDEAFSKYERAALQPPVRVLHRVPLHVMMDGCEYRLHQPITFRAV